MLPEFYQFHHPTKVIYGEGLVTDFAHELEELGVVGPGRGGGRNREILIDPDADVDDVL